MLRFWAQKYWASIICYSVYVITYVTLSWAATPHVFDQFPDSHTYLIISFFGHAVRLWTIPVVYSSGERPVAGSHFRHCLASQLGGSRRPVRPSTSDSLHSSHCPGLSPPSITLLTNHPMEPDRFKRVDCHIIDRSTPRGFVGPCASDGSASADSLLGRCRILDVHTSGPGLNRYYPGDTIHSSRLAATASPAAGFSRRNWHRRNRRVGRFTALQTSTESPARIAATKPSEVQLAGHHPVPRQY